MPSHKLSTPCISSAIVGIPRNSTRHHSRFFHNRCRKARRRGEAAASRLQPNSEPPRLIMQTYDFIIVGSGSAGSVLADKLSASGRFSVLVLEAGGTDR